MKEKWEKQFDELWGCHLKNTPLAKETKSFIYRLLAKERNKFVGAFKKVEE